ncbi:MAG TPA: 4Fe-4S dicluster domain-containing protein, partial [Streptosporangiaceae bacterium]
GCGACLLTCPEHAIRPAGGTLVVLPARCTGCAECLEICPAGVISLPGLDDVSRASDEGARNQ